MELWIADAESDRVADAASDHVANAASYSDAVSVELRIAVAESDMDADSDADGNAVPSGRQGYRLRPVDWVAARCAHANLSALAFSSTRDRERLLRQEVANGAA